VEVCVLPHVTIEAVILAPLLIVQITLFPFVASMMSSKWADSTWKITLEEAGSQMANTIQQLYLSFNRAEVSAGTMIQASTFPAEISGQAYIATGSLNWSLTQSSGKILVLNLTLQKTGVRATVRTPLGPNVLWDEQSLFDSSSPNASIKVRKFVDGTLLFSF